MEGNLRLKIDWANLIVGRKFTVFALFTLYLRAISKYKPPGASIWKGDLTDGFLSYKLGEPILGGAYTWRGLFSEFYGISIQARGEVLRGGITGCIFLFTGMLAYNLGDGLISGVRRGAYTR